MNLPKNLLYFLVALAVVVFVYFKIKGVPEYLDNVPDLAAVETSGIGSSVSVGVGSAVEITAPVSQGGLGPLPSDFVGNAFTQGISSDIVPMDLLPNNNAAAVFAQQNPMGTDISEGQQYLAAGFNVGIDTRGGSMKNPTLDIRPEPLIPKVDVGPWNQSTYEPDMYRQNIFSQ